MAPPPLKPIRLPPAPLVQVYHTLSERYGPQHWWPGDTPFEIMVGAVLTQNAAWSNVEKAIERLRQADALSPESIAEVDPETLGQWIRPSGYFRVKARRLRALCDWLLQRGGEQTIGRWDTDALRAALLRVHGVGPETADDILLYAFDRPVFVIDAYTRRILSRLGQIQGNEPYEALRLGIQAALAGPASDYNEYHALLVRLGKEVCRSKPHCGECCLAGNCPVAKK